MSGSGKGKQEERSTSGPGWAESEAMLDAFGDKGATYRNWLAANGAMLGVAAPNPFHISSLQTTLLEQQQRAQAQAHADAEAAQKAAAMAAAGTPVMNSTTTNNTSKSKQKKSSRGKGRGNAGKKQSASANATAASSGATATAGASEPSSQPDFATIYTYLATLFEPGQQNHAQSFAQLSRADQAAVQLLMHNLAINLSNRGFRDYHAMLIRQYYALLTASQTAATPDMIALQQAQAQAQALAQGANGRAGADGSGRSGGDAGSGSGTLFPTQPSFPGS